MIRKHVIFVKFLLNCTSKLSKFRGDGNFTLLCEAVAIKEHHKQNFCMLRLLTYCVLIAVTLRRNNILCYADWT